MVLQVIGQSFDVGESLTQHVRETVEKKFTKYNVEVIGGNVTFSAAPHKKVGASVNLQIKGKEVFAKSEGDDAYVAFADALADVEKQVLKLIDKERNK